MRRILAIAALAATILGGCAGGPQTPRPTGPPVVQLATWNLEHLAERDGTGCRPRTEADYAALRQHAEQLGADVIALQEVENARAAERVFPSDRWTIVMSERPASTRSGFCRGRDGLTIRQQDVGFAIRKGIPFRRNPDVRAIGLGNPDLRWGVDVTLELPTPIRLLAVHLKSGCNADRNPGDADCDILFRQAPVLEDWIDARARAGEDFAVLGDWNRRMGRPSDAFLEVVSDEDPPAGALILTSAGRRAACVARYPEFIDHIALGRDAARRLVAGSFIEYRYGSAEADHPSDHCPSRIAITAS